MNTLKERVKARRLFLGMTQVQLSQASNVSQANIVHIENGRNSRLRTDTARALATALNVTVAWLVSHHNPLPEEAIMFSLLKDNK